jgi:hypothetical protein
VKCPRYITYSLTGIELHCHQCKLNESLGYTADLYEVERKDRQAQEACDRRADTQEHGHNAAPRDTATQSGTPAHPVAPALAGSASSEPSVSEARGGRVPVSLPPIREILCHCPYCYTVGVATDDDKMLCPNCGEV